MATKKFNKFNIYFTLKLAKEYEACSNGLNKFLSAYPTTTEDEDINILKLLESNGVEHAMWALRCTTADSEEATKSVCVEIAKRAAARAKEYASHNPAASYAYAREAAYYAGTARATAAGDVANAAYYADAAGTAGDIANCANCADNADDARYAAAWAALTTDAAARYAETAGTATKSERKKQKQDFLELLE